MPLARYTMYAWGTLIYVAPTWDSGEPWLSTLRHIAKEGRFCVAGGCSAILNPDDKFIAGPSNKKGEILYAELDKQQMTGPRWKLDVAGDCIRPDVFQLTINCEGGSFINEGVTGPDGELADLRPVNGDRRTLWEADDLD